MGCDAEKKKFAMHGMNYMKNQVCFLDIVIAAICINSVNSFVLGLWAMGRKDAVLTSGTICLIGSTSISH